MEGLIVVKQLPIIEEELKKLSIEIDEKVAKANALVCNEDTVKQVKELRASFNKDFKELETQRKLVKEQVMSPYNALEEVYKVCVSDKYKSADEILKNKIDSVENEIKAEKENKVNEYFNDYLQKNKIDFITYEQTNINITLSASMKSLLEQAKAFIDKIVDDLNLIDTQDHKTEILVEYKQSLNVSQAITSVSNRFKAIEEEKARQEELTKVKQEEQLTIDTVDSVLSAPVEETQEEPIKLIIAKLTVTATKDKLDKLIKFLEEEGYDYE